MAGRIASLLLLLLLAACGPRMVTANVTRFHSLPEAPPGQSFTILPEEAQRGSIEFGTYAELVANALAAQGYRPIAARPGNPASDLVVLLRYGMEEGRTAVWSEPMYSGGLGYGWGPGRHHYGAGIGFPLGSPDIATYSVTNYPKWLEVDVLDGPDHRRGQRRKVFEGRAFNDDSSRDLPGTMPYLVKALFDGFPGESGRTVRVRMPVPGS
ncbi:MAG: DUF4136 domain-containing protein [Rhodospirillales bacterium]|nr:DUF4136 domain-containing protein [Rhodospirillales bacterium]